jgi:phosphate transport system substrate-binding protein
MKEIRQTMRSRSLPAIGIAGALALAVAACGSDGSSESTAAMPSGGSSGAKLSATVNGAGSTFAAPIFQQLGSDLKDRGLTLNYQGVGSGDGVSQLTAGTIDFAGSDPALSDDEAKAMKSPPIQIPFALGAITVSYNVGGLDKGLKLDGETLADLYLGKIKRWNDPAIARQNEGVDLPDEQITVVHRSDSSGTTKGFTQFLAAHSQAWKSGPGVDKDIKWPTGTGAKGNDGVAAAIKQTDGAVGYVEQAYALQNGFTFADVKNQAGKYVAPTLESTSAAGDGIDVPENLAVETIDAPNPAAYPIVSQTFAITYRDPCAAGLDERKAKGLKFLFDHLLGDGQDTIKKLSYAPVPEGLKASDQAAVDTLQSQGPPPAGA